MRYKYEYGGIVDGRKSWNVLSNIHPPKVVATYTKEADAIMWCRHLNLRGKRNESWLFGRKERTDFQ